MADKPENDEVDAPDAIEVDLPEGEDPNSRKEAAAPKASPVSQKWLLPATAVIGLLALAGALHVMGFWTWSYLAYKFSHLSALTGHLLPLAAVMAVVIGIAYGFLSGKIPYRGLLKNTLPFAGVAIMAFMGGTFYNGNSGHSHDNDRPSKRRGKLWSSGNSPSKSGCELYPDEFYCKKEEVTFGKVENCFAHPDSTLDLESENWSMGIPFECRGNGPLSVFLDLRHLHGKPLDFKPVSEIPSKIATHYEENKGVSTKSALVTLLAVLKANNVPPADLADDSPEIAAMILDLSLSSDDGLTEDERKTIAQMLGIYNGFVTLLQGEIKTRQAKIVKECKGYAGKPLVPIRCIAVKPPPSGTPM